jgi:arsenate reductase (thioredoxin)
MAERRVLFVCRDNATSSQMAEALLREAGGNEYEAFSAGIWAGQVAPVATHVMAERGIDMGHHHAKQLGALAGTMQFDYTITLSEEAERRCPDFPGMGVRLFWSLPDPSGVGRPLAEQLEALRSVRDTCDASIRVWLDKSSDEKAEDTDSVRRAS